MCLFENHCVENSLTDKPKKSRYDETSEKVLQKVFAICAPFRNLEGKNAAAFVDALDEFLSATGIEEECERIAASADTAEGRAAGQFYEKIRKRLSGHGLKHPAAPLNYLHKRGISIIIAASSACGISTDACGISTEHQRKEGEKL